METTYNPKAMLDTFWDAALILKRGAPKYRWYNADAKDYWHFCNDPHQLVPRVTTLDRDYGRAWGQGG